MKTKHRCKCGPLSDVPLNCEARIIHINNKSPNRERLIELGFTAESTIIPVHISPFGDPTAYCIKGSVIALRKEDSENIIVEFGGV